ncbi:MAG: insulinase family protein [Ruminococcus sp.]|nr:insulinase family protein [Ruminococcus sp.]
MDLNTGTTICGFTVTRIRELPNGEGRFVEMLHKESGAQLCWADNGINNKLFSVAFRTLPSDDTGVFHILEHSVLCGSAKYPVKEPFLDLMKSSVNTFLNAMTYDDKTLYPISSRSEQDYLNLTSVYLDAVFAPRIVSAKNIFMQEGWHIENDENGAPLYKGVVFNEMKGVFADVDDLAETELHRLMFPDTSYRFVSGGDPKYIPDLTYEKFCDTWRRFYHPSNAIFYLDGAVPLEKTLDMINGYITGYGERPEIPEFSYQEPVSRSSTVRYAVGEDEDITERTNLVLGRISGRFSDRLTALASDVLADYLTSTNESPLTKALLDAGIGQETVASSTLGILQSYFTVLVRNMREEDTEKAKELIFSTVDKIIGEGLDKESLLAYISRMEFDFRLVYEPSGLQRCNRVLDSLLYGGDPLLYIDMAEVFVQLREMVNNGGFEELLRSLFSRDGLCTLVMVPDKEQGRRDADDEKNRLAARTGAMTEEELRTLEEEHRRLLSWQETPDSDEARSTLPVLSLSEISAEPERVDTEVLHSGDTEVVHFTVPCSGITHFSLYFDLGQLPPQTLSHVKLLPLLLADLPTKKHSLPELQKLIKMHIGSLSFPVSVYSKKDDLGHCRPVLSVSCSVLDSEIEKAIEIIREILTETDFSRTDLIKNLLLQKQEDDRQRLIVAGHSIGFIATLSHYSAATAANEQIDGITMMKETRRIAENFDELSGEFCTELTSVLNEAVCMKRLRVAVTSDNYRDIVPLLGFPEGSAVDPEAVYTSSLPERMGVSVPSGVSYAVQSCFLPEVRGAMLIAAQIMSLDCLWNTVRVQGGAYGSGMKATISGSLSCYSYRDPSPARTLGIYGELADALEEWCSSGEDLDKYIISSVAALDPLVSPQKVIQREMPNRFYGMTFEDKVKLRQDMLSVTRESLLALCDDLRRFGREGSVCVTGGPDAIASVGDLETVSV